jgi:hypothetical protein
MPAAHFQLNAGASTDLLGDTYSITVRRGLAAAGVTDELSPATFTAVIKGSPAANPLTNPDVRPYRPVQLLAGIEDQVTGVVEWHTVFTGIIQRARLEYDTTAKDDPEAYRVHITATDRVAALAAFPSEAAVSGSLTQRVAAVLDPSGVPYVVTDNEPAATSSTALPSEGRTAVDQLRLIRDTLHAVMYVDRDGVVQVIADNARSRTVTSPDYIATDAADGGPEGAIHYHDVTPAFDTDSVVNVLTIKKLGDVEATYTDEDSRDEWGDKPQTITVNDGLAETHAGLYLATRTDPDLIPEHLAFAVALKDEDKHLHRAEHLAAACTIEIAKSVQVIRVGLADHTLIVRDITHTITPVRWSVGLGLRVPEVLGTRWDDVPADLTWDDVPADLTWDDAVNWHPYL